MGINTTIANTLPTKNDARPTRILALDVLKCFAIFLVLWGHGIQHLTTGECEDNYLFRWIYSFHMPLFMLVAGFLSIKSSELPFFSFLGKKIKQIILPAFVWQCIFIVLGVLVWKNELHLSANPLRYLPFWFLWALLICNLLSYLGRRIKYGKIITLFFSQLIPFANVIYMYPAFLLGVVIAENKDWFNEHIKQILALSTAIYLVAMLFWGKSAWHLLAQTQECVHLHGYIPATFFYISKTLYKILVNLSGALMFFCMFSITNRIWDNAVGRFWGFIGKYTLAIYILQSFILESRLPMYVNLDQLNPILFNFVVTPLIALVVMFICVGIAALADTNRYTRLLLLGR